MAYTEFVLRSNASLKIGRALLTNKHLTSPPLADTLASSRNVRKLLGLV